MAPPLHITDSERLREFARKLQGFSHDVGESLVRIHGQTAQLGGSWKDQGFEEFNTELNRTTQLLRRLSAEVDRVTPLLQQDADDIDAYVALKTPQGL